MITTPTIKLFEPFDATKDFIIYFNYTGSVQILKNHIIIEDVSNGQEIYNKEISTFLFQHNLNANSLTNGKTYRVKVRVADIENNYSQFSTSYIFYVNSLPTIQIRNIIDEKVNNQNIIFEAIYTQLENMKLQSYQYHLYSENKRLINSFPVKYEKDIDTSLPSVTLLKQEVTNLKNNTKYFVRITTRSIKGQIGDSGYIPFYVSYIAPKVNSLLGLDNVCVDGAVKVKIIGKRILMKLFNHDEEIPPENIDYIDNEKIDLNRQDYYVLVADKTFSIEKDNFILQLWIENIQHTGRLNSFLRISSRMGILHLSYYDKAFHIFKIYNNSSSGMMAHFKSNELDITKYPNSQFSIWIRSENGMIDIRAEVM